MSEPSSWSLLPPAVAIGTALATRQVLLSLFSGIWLGWTILAGGNPIRGLEDALESIVFVFSDRGNVLIVIFSTLIGAFIALTQRSGGVAGFVELITGRGWVRGPRGARLLPTFIGMALFLESNLTCLVAGSVARPLFDRYRLAREQLAYLVDATAAPVCVLFPFNAYGAVLLGILASQGVPDPLPLFVSSLPFNFYAILSVGLALYLAATGRDFGPMAAASRRARETGQLVREGGEPLVSDEVTSLDPKPGVTPRARNMLVPTFLLLVMVALGLRLTDGDGSTAIFWGMLLAVTSAAAMAVADGSFSVSEAVDTAVKGMGGLVPVVLLIVLAFSLGATTRELEAGAYLARVTDGVLNPVWLPAVLFLLGCVTSFATGTSWGTFAIVLPIGVAMATSLDVDLRIVIGAVVGGGIFGDHCSPISDTTIVSSLAAGSDHIDHVNTQLPYALATAALATVLSVLSALWL